MHTPVGFSFRDAALTIYAEYLSRGHLGGTFIPIEMKLQEA
jgi:hypothetical protein